METADNADNADFLRVTKICEFTQQVSDAVFTTY
jgi:hypothetical protein